MLWTERMVLPMCIYLFIWDRVLLCSPSWHLICVLLASTSQIVGLQESTPQPAFMQVFCCCCFTMFIAESGLFGVSGEVHTYFSKEIFESKLSCNSWHKHNSSSCLYDLMPYQDLYRKLHVYVDLAFFRLKSLHFLMSQASCWMKHFVVSFSLSVCSTLINRVGWYRHREL